MAVSPQCLTLDGWPAAMSFRLFVETAALITWSLYLAHPSFLFLCSCTPFFLLFQAIRRHFQIASNQTETKCCITASAWACNRQDSPRLFFCPFIPACLSLSLCSQWLHLSAPTHAVPAAFPLEGVSLLSDPGAS